jgi:putative protease
MNTNTTKIELLAPAGDFEKLEIAIHYGADAVYLAGKDFSLRNFSGNFSIEELHRAVEIAHARGVKLYLACNIYSRNFEQNAIAEFLKVVRDIGPDAVIIADPGIFRQARKYIPHIAIHLSTQANTTNYKSAQFWQELGVRRINAARELSLKEIALIASNSTVEIEAFVHGAMCISYSGRCLLSSFMANRDSNRGLCAHACRWKYAIAEETRPGDYMPIMEDQRGTYILHSHDLCMIEHIPQMISAGIASLKIEGRMKGIHYLATTVNVYRQAIDSYYSDPANYRVKNQWIKELAALNHRGYITGFYFGEPDQQPSMVEKHKSVPRPLFVGKVIERQTPQNIKIEVRNKICRGDCIEVLHPGSPAQPDKILDIIDSDQRSLPLAQPGNRVSLSLNHDYSPNDLIRKVSAKS